MSKLIISKKGSIPGAILLLIVISFIGCFLMFKTMPDGMDFDDDEALVGLISFATPFLFLALGAFGIASCMRYSKAYINVYDDHIEGYGVLGKGSNRGQNFSIDNHINYTTNLEGSYVVISCNGASYYIYLSLSDAQQVYRVLTSPGSSSAYTNNASSTGASYARQTAESVNKASSSKPLDSSTSRTDNTLISFTCPNCKAQYKINAKICESFNCTKCGKEYRIKLRH